MIVTKLLYGASACGDDGSRLNQAARDKATTALLTVGGNVGAGGRVINEADQRFQDAIDEILLTRTQSKIA